MMIIFVMTIMFRMEMSFAMTEMFAMTMRFAMVTMFRLAMMLVMIMRFAMTMMFFDGNGKEVSFTWASHCVWHRNLHSLHFRP